jgi:hypothetical protein
MILSRRATWLIVSDIRLPPISPSKCAFRRSRLSGKRAEEIAEVLKASRASVFRILKAA